MSGVIFGVNPLSRWLLFGEWRAHPMRAVLAVVAIAVGVAMGFAIHLINAAAFNEFNAAVHSLSGQADVQVTGREALFDEGIYPRLATHEGVALASPVLEVDAARADGQGSLKIVGLDAFRAGYIAPDLMGVPDASHPYDVLADDAVFQLRGRARGGGGGGGGGGGLGGFFKRGAPRGGGGGGGGG
ncbi:hypothetical protein ACEN88_29990, partial [Massilia sp. CT11-108]